jgi:hypothetical protein
MDIVISNTGTLWNSGGHELPRPPLLGPGALAGLKQGGPTSYAVVQLRPNGACLRLPRGGLTQACFERVVWLFVHYKIDRAIFDFNDDHSPRELVTSLQDVVARLDEVRGAGPGGPPRTAFSLERLSLGRLDEPRRAALRRAFSSWARARGKISTKDLDREVGCVDGERMLLRIQPAERLQVEAFAGVVSAYRPCERMAALGRDVKEQPDDVYGTWMADIFRDFAREPEREPSLQMIDAVIASPVNGNAVRVRWERLLLPWQTPGGDRWITSAPVVRMRRIINH